MPPLPRGHLRIYFSPGPVFRNSLSSPGSSMMLGWRSAGNVLIERLLDRLFRNVADDLLLHLAVLEDQQGGNAADAVALRRSHVLVHIHLAYLDLAAVRGGDFVHDGRQRLTRTAPSGPEIHHHRLLRLEHVAIEALVGQFHNSVPCHLSSETSVRIALF